jgi:hypothetical protein
MTFLNVGPFDRAIRIVLGIALAMLAWIAWPGTLAVLFAVAAAVALVTGIVGWCAGYALFGISTLEKARS